MLIFTVILALCVGGLAFERYRAEQVEKNSCIREYHFLHSYTQSLDRMRDMIALVRVDRESFAVADGKMRDSLIALDELAGTLPEKKLIIEERSQVEAYELCSRTSLDNCFSLAQAASDSQEQTFKAISNTIIPCDRFDLPVK